MATSASTGGSATTPTLYFAYGSNLSTTQMAARCPFSRLVGVGRLTQYTWLINGRGYANVVDCNRLSATPARKEPNVVESHPPASTLAYHDAPVSTSSEASLPATQTVWGLLYELPAPDEARLDRAEGVPGCYGKEWLAVQYWPLDASQTPSSAGGNGGAAAQFQEVRDPFMPADGEAAVEDHVAEEARRAERRDAPRSSDVADPATVPSGRANVRDPPRQVSALVYVDRQRIVDGSIQAEYVMRMRRGCAEAEERGLPADWLDEVIRPWLEPEVEK